MDLFEWDEDKAGKCFAERNISFHDAAVALSGLAITGSSHREDEARFASICDMNGLLIVVVWTLRGQTRRIVTARRARNDERERYRQAVTRAAQAR